MILWKKATVSGSVAGQLKAGIGCNQASLLRMIKLLKRNGKSFTRDVFLQKANETEVGAEKRGFLDTAHQPFYLVISPSFVYKKARSREKSFYFFFFLPFVMIMTTVIERSGNDIFTLINKMNSITEIKESPLNGGLIDTSFRPTLSGSKGNLIELAEAQNVRDDDRYFLLRSLNSPPKCVLKWVVVSSCNIIYFLMLC